jgi:hypothetical protein
VTQKRLVAVESLTRRMLVRTIGVSGRRPDTHQSWIPAPRFHEDKLRGNDRGRCRDESLPGFCGVMGARNAPLRRFAVMVQRSAAGVWGVPRFLLSSPKSGGPRGLIVSVRRPLQANEAVNDG